MIINKVKNYNWLSVINILLSIGNKRKHVAINAYIELYFTIMYASTIRTRSIIDMTTTDIGLKSNQGEKMYFIIKIPLKIGPKIL